MIYSTTGQRIASLGAPKLVGYEDRDNFVRNLVTILGAGVPLSLAGIEIVAAPMKPTPLSKSAKSRAAVIPLDLLKTHLRADPLANPADQAAEDLYLESLERAARLHAENVLRRTIDETVGETVIQAMLLLIAQWYRQRENVAPGTITAVPQAFDALLAPERDYADCY